MPAAVVCENALIDKHTYEVGLYKVCQTVYLYIRA